MRVYVVQSAPEKSEVIMDLTLGSTGFCYEV